MLDGDTEASNIIISIVIAYDIRHNLQSAVDSDTIPLSMSNGYVVVVGPMCVKELPVESVPVVMVLGALFSSANGPRAEGKF